MEFENSLDFARKMDANDILASFRNHFIIPERNGVEQIYFLGNSLGLQPRTASECIREILQQWAKYGVEAFFQGDSPWMNYHYQLSKVISGIVGAQPQEVVIMNQLTVNLHLMMVSFYQPKGTRNKIICEARAFPSDQYMFETHLKHQGFNPDEVLIEISPRTGEHLLRTGDILDAIEANKDELALVLFGGVNYYTGQLFDMKSITAAAHKAGAYAGFDLAHAAGNVHLALHEWDVDFACWCSYKYLNSGPGAVAAAYIHERFHMDSSLKRFAGWWGVDQESRFKMEKGFKPVLTAEGWQLSTPPLLLLACHKASLDIFEKAGMKNLVQKGRQLSSYLLFILNQINQESDRKLIEILTPQNENERGCQVSMLMLQNGKMIFDELSNEGVFADWREPDVIRLAPVPLYNKFEEVWKFGEILGRKV